MITVLVSLLLLIGVGSLGGSALALLDCWRGKRSDVPCVCGHTVTAHEHYRSGSDCSLCTCPGWLPVVKLRDRQLPAEHGVTFVESETARLDDELRELLGGAS